MERIHVRTGVLRSALVASLLILAIDSSIAQDSVDVTFRYQNPSVSGVTLPGEFNAWNNAAWPMTNTGGGLWARTARLRVGGNPAPNALVPGAWQYKFYYSGATTWPNDPLNHHVNPSDNNNSFLYTKDPTIYQLLPNQRQPIVMTSTPTVTAYIFPKVGASVDTSTLQVSIDGTVHSGIGGFYDPGTKLLSYELPAPLTNGSHTMILRAGSSVGGSNADTVMFVVQSGYVQITSQGGYETRALQKTLYGAVQNPGVTSVTIVHNDADSTSVSVSSGRFTATIGLVEGMNTFRALADSSGILVASSPVTFTQIVNHSPNAVISFQDIGSAIVIHAKASTDPDTGQTATLTYAWTEEPENPAVIGGITGSTANELTVARPSAVGEYFFRLIVSDVDGHRDTTRNYFTLDRSLSFSAPTLASVPQWVRGGRMYSMFFKMHTPAGTINAAYPDLNRIAAMGYDIIWVLPVMKNRDPINNGPGPGYNIIDFATVAPEYGTNDDMRNFISRAHQLGIKVILDITPNHTSSSHPFVLDARAFRESSRYWSYYQHQIIPYSGTGFGELSQSITADGFVYYGAFSDAILNYNWADPDARQYMIDVYKYWISQMGADGYRFDVYWGPFTRTNSPNGGESEMGQPVRQALKHMRPDIHLLGEASGTGAGTEKIYADYAGPGGPGGVDAAYDWSLKGYVQDANLWNQPAGTLVNNLDTRLRNGSGTSGMGYIPGPNSYFLRFLENHDEDRISFVYGTSVDAATARARTMPVSTAVNLAVGLPMVYAGQEIGRGYGISNFDVRRRGVINWGDSAGLFLMPHYQKLAQIKKQYPAFTTQSMVRATTDFSGVYAYTRPFAGGNGVVVANFESTPHSATVTLTATGATPTVAGVTDGVAYTATDLYNGNETQSVVFSGGVATLPVNIAAFGSAVFVLDTIAHTLTLPSLTAVDEPAASDLPGSPVLEQNYPNPFNPTTTIQYVVPSAGEVSLKVFDLMGREVATLVEGHSSSGRFTVAWDARTDGGRAVASGIYFYRLRAPGVSGESVIVRKMMVLR
ncbi:MAG: alpha-amylase family glycosyl hydrolase [Bacteroidota bacterium]